MNTLLRAALLVTTVGSIAAAQPGPTAAGCVVDAVTRQPITHVAVTVRGGSVTTVTDSLGFFILRGIRVVADRSGFGPSVSPRDTVILIFSKSGLYLSNWEYVSAKARSPIPLLDVRLRPHYSGLGDLRTVRSDTSASALANRPRWEALHRACVAAVQKTTQGT
jgi:hypothetical protein